MAERPLDPVSSAADLSVERRLKRFVRDENSDPARLFARRNRSETAGDWYGEHLGKWLSAASHAALRTRDEALTRSIGDIVSFLAREQDADGYLGTYAQTNPARFDRESAERVRTWDLWNVAYLLGGLLDAAAISPTAQDVASALAAKIVAAFHQERAILAQGNHVGLSSAALVWPFARYVRTDPAEANLAFLSRLIGELDAEPRRLISGPLEGRDASRLGTGKAYQLCLAYGGLVEAATLLDRSDWLDSAKQFWTNVRERHLTPWGGPWGGVGSHLEVFNGGDFFSPFGLVETCSTMAWMDLSRMLYDVMGESCFAEEWERSGFNALLGARHANGEDWAYFSPANGPRSEAYEWACCKSSGALALERFAGLRTAVESGGLTISSPYSGTFQVQGATVEVQTTYPMPGPMAVTVHTPEPVGFAVRFRANARVECEEPWRQVADWWVADRVWTDGDTLRVNLTMSPEVVRAEHRVVHHERDILRLDYLALRAGPLCYAFEPLDGFVREATVRMPTLFTASRFRQTHEGYELDAPGHDPIRFVPFAEAGRNRPDGWRHTWLPVVWQ